MGALIENPLRRALRDSNGLVGEWPGPGVIGVIGTINPSLSFSAPMSF